MKTLLKHIEALERIDHLIRLKATGGPKTLARKFEISEASVYRLIEAMKELGAPVEFSHIHQSYIYTDEVKFSCGFFARELSDYEYKNTNGGSIILNFFSDNFPTIRK